MPSQPGDLAGTLGIGVRVALRSRSRVARTARSIARWSALMASLALVVFHISLFWERLIGGDLVDPAVALRWLAAAGLVAALVFLRRMGVPVASGRKAFVLWLLVLLLHASGGRAPAASSDLQTGVDAGLIFVLPSTLTVVGLGLLYASIARRRLAAFAVLARFAEPGVACRLSDGWRRGGTTRAPPITAS